jgi:hypothetical protein
MADDITVPGTGEVLAFEEAGGKKYSLVKIVDGTHESATPVTGVGGALSVAGTVTANLSATDNAVLDAIALAVATEGDALGDGVLMQGDDGTDRTNVLVDTAGHLQVDVQSAPEAVVAGKVAEDSAVSAAPVTIGGRGLNGPAATTDVSADGDVVNMLMTRSGRPYVATYHPNFWTATVHDHNTAQTAHSLVAAPGGALCLYVTDIIISNGATAGTVEVHDTDRTISTGDLYLAANGGCVINLKTPMKCLAAHALEFTSVTVTTHTVTVCGFTAA